MVYNVHFLFLFLFYFITVTIIAQQTKTKEVLSSTFSQYLQNQQRVERKIEKNVNLMSPQYPYPGRPPLSLSSTYSPT